jgi:hypothetical protein
VLLDILGDPGRLRDTDPSCKSVDNEYTDIPVPCFDVVTGPNSYLETLPSVSYHLSQYAKVGGKTSLPSHHRRGEQRTTLKMREMEQLRGSSVVMVGEQTDTPYMRLKVD